MAERIIFVKSVADITLKKMTVKLKKKKKQKNNLTLFNLKGQYHAIFSNTLKIEKTLFG